MNMVAKLPRSDPYHVPQYWMIFYLVRSIHVKKMATWCLHKFPRNAHSHVQQTYLVKGSGTLYAIFQCCWLRTIHAWLVSFKSSIPWVTLVWGINVAFSTLVFTMRSTTFFFYEPMFFHFRHVHVMSCNHCCESPQ
jgi:hypothetical protein